MSTYYIFRGSLKYNPLKQYCRIKSSNEKNVIINLHFPVSIYFSNKQNQFVNHIFVKNNQTSININEIFDIFMNNIYQPNFIIKNKVNKFLTKIKNSFVIGMHIRTGIFADFKENAPWFGGINSTNRFIQHSLNISKIYNNTKWIVCSDSSNISYSIKEKYKKYVMNYNEYFKYPSRLKNSRDFILKK